MKRLSAVFLCLALLAGVVLSAGAEEAPEFLHPFLRVEDSALCLTGAPLGDGAVTVTVNGQSFSHCSVSTVEEAGLPVTYYCIVDQSSSLSNSQKEQQRRALTALSDALRSVDSMVLVLMGEEISFGERLTTAQERQQAIEDACVYPAKFTNLNDSIVTAVQTISAAQDSESLNCILLITDGLDNARIPVSQEQVEEVIRSSGLSLCTLSVVDPWADKAAQKNASRMAQYADQSVGGCSVIPSRNDFGSATYVEDALNEILAQVLSGSVISLDVTQLPTTQDTLEIQVSWEREGTRLVSARSVDTALLPTPPAPTEPETTEPETTQPETTEPEITEPETTQPETMQPETVLPPQPDPTSSDRGNGNLLLICIPAGFVLLILLVVLALVLRRKQRALEQAETEPREKSAEPVKEKSPGEDRQNSPRAGREKRPKAPREKHPKAEEKQNKPDLSAPEEWEKALDFWTAPPAPNRDISIPRVDFTPGCRVRLVPENHPQGTVEFTIGVNESKTLGRNDRADIVLNETDRALSSVHFELQWDSRVLHIRDRKSTNGTALNGVPMRPETWLRVENKAVIQAGDARYTVFVEKK